MNDHRIAERFWPPSRNGAIASVLLTAVALMLFGCYACASEDQTLFAETLIPSQASALVSRNGEFWNGVPSRRERVALVTGIEEGVALTLFYAELERNWDAVKLISESLKSWNSPERLDPVVMADQITLFYSNEKNLRIPILRAFVHITSAKNGASPELATKHLELLRQQYATPLRASVPALEPIPAADGDEQPTAEKEVAPEE